MGDWHELSLLENVAAFLAPAGRPEIPRKISQIFLSRGCHVSHCGAADADPLRFHRAGEWLVEQAFASGHAGSPHPTRPTRREPARALLH
jgi:hypothetical protein